MRGIIWGYDVDIEEFGDLDDALGRCWGIDQGEFWWDSLEIDGKVYTRDSPEFRALESRYDRIGRERWESQPKPIARVEARPPGDADKLRPWEGWKMVDIPRSEAELSKAVDEWTALIGSDRVRVVRTP